MDISVIKPEFVNDLNGIKIGSDQAPKRIIEFMNLRCPFCKQWFEESQEILGQAVADGKVQRIIKLLDKDKESLQRGNVMHEYISSDSDKALQQILQVYASQDEWKELSLEQVAHYAETVLHLQQQPNQALQQEIRNEAEQSNIKFVPTVLVDDHIFDESVTQDQLKEFLSL
ncbi:DsbA family protein [Enterococcus sp. 669A]|uniref:DsbA family protein n=1 Tax=Candidatus Enterococcus moelleringii TaxID=2815325 RepID=A0ABS3L758_9ENTE|nr:thioredoxin domain-containing protein [Enterococcus sp. 669A]MBO1305454.1 DsbA family protein [Enterococcus sp. 669A]